MSGLGAGVDSFYEYLLKVPARGEGLTRGRGIVNVMMHVTHLFS